MKTLLIAARFQPRKTLNKVLKRRGHDVTVAKDPDAACSALRSGDYRLVVVETDDPQGEGARLCRRLRGISPIGRCLILAAGESTEPQHVRALLAAGADDYVTGLDDARRLQIRLTVAEHAVGNPVELEGIVEDVTEQKRVQEALRESEQRFRSIFENAADGILVADVQTRELRSGNPAICRMLGYRPEEIPALKVVDLLREEDLSHGMSAFARQLKEYSHLGKEIPIKRRDGTVFYADICGVPLVVAGKACLAGIFRDVTERREAEQVLRESEAKLRALFENLPDVVIIVDQNATIQHLNHTVAGAPVDQFVGTRGFDSIAPEYRERCQHALQQAIETRQVQTVEYLGVRGVWWACRLVPMIEQDEVRGVMIICTDVTEQKAATQAIQKEQQLLRHLLDLHERDRQLTAYEIHDGFSQYLTGALFHLQSFRELQTARPEDAWQTFDTGMALINRSIHETRRLIGGLRPPILDESGVVAAIDYLACEAVENDQAEVEFVHDVQFERLAPPLESAIFRIVQESLNNARRHSQSEKIRVELRQRDGRIQIGVRDWGIGFIPQKVEEGRFGLQGIRERARLFGGQVTIATAPDEGTQIRVELPLIEAPPPP